MIYNSLSFQYCFPVRITFDPCLSVTLVHFIYSFVGSVLNLNNYFRPVFTTKFENFSLRRSDELSTTIYIYYFIIAPPTGDVIILITLRVRVKLLFDGFVDTTTGTK